MWAQRLVHRGEKNNPWAKHKRDWTGGSHRKFCHTTKMITVQPIANNTVQYRHIWQQRQELLWQHCKQYSNSSSFLPVNARFCFFETHAELLYGMKYFIKTPLFGLYSAFLHSHRNFFLFRTGQGSSGASPAVSLTMQPELYGYAGVDWLNWY